MTTVKCPYPISMIMIQIDQYRMTEIIAVFALQLYMALIGTNCKCRAWWLGVYTEVSEKDLQRWRGEHNMAKRHTDMWSQVLT